MKLIIIELRNYELCHEESHGLKLCKSAMLFKQSFAGRNIDINKLVDNPPVQIAGMGDQKDVNKS